MIIRPLPDKKYSVIYADPPWPYDNKSSSLDPSRHYKSMTMIQLCKLRVKSIRKTNCVLFLWVPTPLLEQPWHVIRTWGFTYKTEFIWHKMKHNIGFYLSNRHEHLFLCVHGKGTPQNKRRMHSVISIPRTPQHSQKPSLFRSIISDMYPTGNKIELFARERAAGWDAWGDQCPPE